MPIWLVIMALGATGCGFLFLKARQIEGEQVKRKVKQGSKDVRIAARRSAARDTGIVPYEALRGSGEVTMSKDLSSRVVEEAEKILAEKGEG